jgi:hypothetical protein
MDPMLPSTEIDHRYIEPLFGMGPPAACREQLGRVVPEKQLALYAVAWFAHAIAREGLAAYLQTSSARCVAELGHGLRLLGEPDVADAIALLAEQPRPRPRLLAAVERRVPDDLYDLVVDHARAHAVELVPLDCALPLVRVAPTHWN